MSTRYYKTAAFSKHIREGCFPWGTWDLQCVQELTFWCKVETSNFSMQGKKLPYFLRFLEPPTEIDENLGQIRLAGV